MTSSALLASTTRFAVAAVVASTALLVAAPAHASETLEGTIAFVSERTGNDELYIMDATGDHVRQLTESAGFDRAPSWSADGTAIAFNSRREPHPDRPQIYSLDLGTGIQSRLTDSAQEEQRAAWAADGRSVYLHRGAFLTQPYNLVKYDIESGAETLLTDSTDPRVWNAAPAPSPDGTRLLFQSNRDAPASVFPQTLQLLDLATLDVTPLFVGLPAGTSIDGPRWNSTGSAFAFASGGRLFVTEATGDPSGWIATPVTDGVSDDASPAFSPDGTRLVFQTTIEGDDPDGELDSTVIRVLTLATGDIVTLGEGRTPVWTAANWTTSPSAAAVHAPALPATGAGGNLLVPAGLLAAGALALVAARLVPSRRAAGRR